MKEKPTAWEMLKCAERELALRRTVYNKRVLAGKMRPDVAQHEIACMAAILQNLRKQVTPELPFVDDP